MIDQPYQFDFYDGGGLDLAFLSFAEVDAAGNVNVSRFGNRIVGPGGFINISQNAKSVVFGGNFSAGQTEMSWPGDCLRIDRDGAKAKFVASVEQITYSGTYGCARGQRVLYVTERAVFQLGSDGLELIEIAPGVDLKRDVLDRMDFKPNVSPTLRLMDSWLFGPRPINLKAILESKPAKAGPERLEARSEGTRLKHRPSVTVPL